MCAQFFSKLRDNPISPEADPYAQPPSFWRRHAGLFGVVAVFVLTAAFTVFAFPPYRTPELAYVFAAPGVFWAFFKPSFRLYAGVLLGAQMVAWTFLLGWLHHVTWGGLLLLGPFIGLWVGAWFLAVWWTVPRMMGKQTLVRILAMLGLGGLWVLNEWLRTWLLSGFPWLPLAASQWQRSAMLQVASYTGALGISFVLIVFNFGFATYWHRLLREREGGMKRRSPEFLVTMVILVVPALVLLEKAQGQQRRLLAEVSVVQPYIPQELKWDGSKSDWIFETLGNLTANAAQIGPDVLLWPEAVTPFAVRGEPQAQQWVEEMTRRAKKPLLLGSVSIEAGADGKERWTNAALLVTPEGGLQSPGYAKRKLVPFGEYVPFRGALGWLQKFVPIGDGDFQPGEKAELLSIPLRGRTVSFGPLICFEDIFPKLATESALAGADVLVVMTNNAWFGEGSCAYQHAAHSVLRAVEARRPVVRCGNSGWSGWIDEYGNIRGVLADSTGNVYVRGTKLFAVTQDERWDGRQSFYTMNGDWFVGVAAGLVLIGWLAVRFSRVVPPKPVAEDE